VAYEVAKALHLPLDALIVRKLGAPFHEELALGAIAGENICVFNEALIEELNIEKTQLAKVIEKEEIELARRNKKYRQGQPLPNIQNQQVIVVDDGIATGASLRAAVLVLQSLKPKKIILAVPVAPASTLEEFRGIVDEIICPATPEPFYGVGMWYQHFPQTTDEAVCQLLYPTHLKMREL
jgi:predicted phosphoribosyltransferase